MKLCPKCNHSPWPFVMVFFIASVTGFVTWLVVGLSVEDMLQRTVAGALAFLAVGGTLLHYVLDCLKRHCRHDHRHKGPTNLKVPRAGNAAIRNDARA